MKNDNILNEFNQENNFFTDTDTKKDTPNKITISSSIPDLISLRSRKIPRHFGNNCVFFFIKGEPLITIGPHWPMLICMIILIITTGHMVSNTIARYISTQIYIISILIAIMNLIFYMLAALKNPGIASKEMEDSLSQIDNENFCKPCKIYKSDKICHCYDCDICVEGFDHHCPWTSKCIGKGNKIYFKVLEINNLKVFVITTFVQLIFSVIMTAKSIG